jgi:hypothetical protein
MDPIIIILFIIIGFGLVASFRSPANLNPLAELVRKLDHCEVCQSRRTYWFIDDDDEVIIGCKACDKLEKDYQEAITWHDSLKLSS